MITARAYDIHVEQLLDRLRRIHAALDAARISYRIVGGVGVFLQITERDPDLARMTRDLDLAVQRDDLQRIIAAAQAAGFRYRHAAGVDMLFDSSNPKGVAIHLIFAHERAEPSYLEATPFSEPAVAADGYLVAPVADLVRMKLTSFRLKDRVHIQDMDGVRLITPEIESALPEVLRERLAQVRATE
jgi:Uncharacterised nucleotidyltransferase